MPTTFSHGLLPSTCLLSLPYFRGLKRRQKIRLFVVAGVLGNLCDLDLIPTLFLKKDLFLSIHRAWGHNLISIALLTLLGSWTLHRFTQVHLPRGTRLLTSFCLVFSHVILDASSDSGPDGSHGSVPLLWPFSNWGFKLPWEFYESAQIDFSIHPILGHILAPNLFTILYQELIWGLTFFLLWIVIQEVWRLIQKIVCISPFTK